MAGWKPRHQGSVLGGALSSDEEKRATVRVLQELAECFPDRGFGKYIKVIRRHGYKWNHKRVHRICCALNLNRRRMGKRRLPPRTPLPLAVEPKWSMDFMSDALWNGRRFRTFNVADDFNREVLGDLTPGEYRVLHHAESSSYRRY